MVRISDDCVSLQNRDESYSLPSCESTLGQIHSLCRVNRLEHCSNTNVSLSLECCILRQHIESLVHCGEQFILLKLLEFDLSRSIVKENLEKGDSRLLRVDRSEVAEFSRKLASSEDSFDCRSLKNSPADSIDRENCWHSVCLLMELLLPSLQAN